jgi:esterase/lipase superfamily enzyme
MGALCLSGRYRGTSFSPGASSDELDFNDPLAFVPNLEGAALERVRQQTHLTLVVGRGPFEGGTDSRRDSTRWKRQVAHYLPQVC